MLCMALLLFLVSSCGRKEIPSDAHEKDRLSDQVSIDSPDVVDKRNSDPEFQVPVDGGFIIWGLEVIPVAKGLIPFALIDLTAINVDLVNVEFKYKNLGDEFQFLGTLDFTREGRIISTSQVGRVLSYVPRGSHNDVKIEDFGNVMKYSCAQMVENSEIEPIIKYTPVLYYAKSLDELRALVKISESAPLWDWHSVILTPDDAK